MLVNENSRQTHASSPTPSVQSHALRRQKRPPKSSTSAICFTLQKKKPRNSAVPAVPSSRAKCFRHPERSRGISNTNRLVKLRNHRLPTKLRLNTRENRRLPAGF